MIFQSSHEGHLKFIVCFEDPVLCTGAQKETHFTGSSLLDFFEKGRTSITPESSNVGSKPLLDFIDYLSTSRKDSPKG